MTTPEDPKDVRPALRRAEAELARHLAEACDDHDRERIGEESTDELLRLEEELLAAARAADEAVRLRRRLGEGERTPSVGRSGTEATPSDANADAVPAADAARPEDPSSRVRQFRTASGSEWRVWEVRPAAADRPRKLELYPADYVQGWLAFEVLEGEARKRLPKFTSDWRTAADADLEALLEQAVDVPKRKPR
jgi:hypothetical protein